MKLLLQISMFLIINCISYSFKITNPAFDKSIVKGEKASKSYIIENNSLHKKVYEITFEKDDLMKKITPSKFYLKPNTKKVFLLEISTDENTKIGDYEYKLLVRERTLDLKKENNSVDINMIYRIKQKYKVIGGK